PAAKVPAGADHPPEPIADHWVGRGKVAQAIANVGGKLWQRLPRRQLSHFVGVPPRKHPEDGVAEPAGPDRPGDLFDGRFDRVQASPARSRASRSASATLAAVPAARAARSAASAARSRPAFVSTANTAAAPASSDTASAAAAKTRPRFLRTNFRRR